jgi:hypothetical protein
MKQPLQLCLSLYEYGVDKPHSEREILINLPQFLAHFRASTMLLTVNSGVISIYYNGEEIVGQSYGNGTEVHLFMEDLFYRLPEILQAKSATTLSLRLEVGKRITLSASDEHILYQLHAREDSTPWVVILERKIPRQLFVKQVIFFFFRFIRIFILLGAEAKVVTDFDLDNPDEREAYEEAIIGYDYAKVLENWRELETVQLLSDSEKKELEQLIAMPLEQWVAQAGCDDATT